MASKSSRWGLAAVAASALLLALVVANVSMVAAATKPVVTDEAVGRAENATVALFTVSASAGDVVRLTAAPPSPGLGPDAPAFDLYVVEVGTAAETFRTGAPPAAALVHVPSTSPLWRESGPGVDVEVPATATEGVDVLLIFPGEMPAAPRVQVGPYDAWVGVPFASLGLRVIPAWLLAAQPFLYAAEALAAVAALAAGFLWLRAPTRAGGAGDEGRLSGLIALTERAGDYLESLRNSALLVGVLLAFLGVAGGVAATEALAAIDLAKPTPAWGTLMAFGLAAAYALAVAAWLRHYVRLELELRRWRARAAENPLEA